MKRNLIILAWALITVLITSTGYGQQLWTSGGLMPYSIARAEAIVHDSDIFLLGGYSDSLNGFPFIQKFRPGLGWTLAGQFRPRMDFVAGVDSDRIYCLGGTPAFLGGNPREDSSIDTIGFREIGDGDQYDADSSFRRISSTGLVYHGIFYLFGGLSRDPVPYVLEYNLHTREHRGYGDRHVISGQMSARIGDDIFLFGGVAAGVTRTIVKYNTVTHTILVLPIGLSRPRAFGKAIHIENSDSIMIMGGIDENNHPLNTVEVFHWAPGHLPSLNPGPRLHFPRSHFAAAQLNGSIYVFGGLDDPQRGLTLNSIEVLSVVNGVDSDNGAAEPSQFSLNQNYPNPFNPSTTIPFSVQNSAYIRLEIFSVLGEKMQTLVDEKMQAGEHDAIWNGLNNQGQPAPSGVYFCRLAINGQSLTRKMILAR